MNKADIKGRKWIWNLILVPTLLLFISAASALFIGEPDIVQTKAKFVEGDYLTGFDLGENGVAFVTSSYKDGGCIATVRNDGTYNWTQTFPHESKWYNECEFAYSVDGMDLYTIMLDNGGKTVHINWIDVASGTVQKNLFKVPEVKGILCKYATAKFLFLLTSNKYYEDNSFRRDPGTTLYRFDKSDKSFTKLASDSGISSLEGTFKQFVRVTESYADAYYIDSVDNRQVRINFERVDTSGKKIRTVGVTLFLERSFTRQCNSALINGRGIERGHKKDPHRHPSMVVTTVVGHGPDGREIIDVVEDDLVKTMATCYILYSQLQHCYYITGLCGQDAPEKGNGRCTGFYVAKLDTEFQLLEMKEYAMMPLLNNDTYFNLYYKSATRYLENYIDPVTGDLIVYCYSRKSRIMFTIDRSDLSLKNSQSIGGMYFNLQGNMLLNDYHFLIHDARVISQVQNYRDAPMVYYLSTFSRKYSVIVPINDKEITISSVAIGN